MFIDCGGQLSGPNGVIQYNNSSFARSIRTWHFTCEWTVTVKPGRTIKIQIEEMSISEMPDHTCGNNYLLVSTLY